MFVRDPVDLLKPTSLRVLHFPHCAEVRTSQHRVSLQPQKALNTVSLAAAALRSAGDGKARGSAPAHSDRMKKCRSHAYGNDSALAGSIFGTDRFRNAGVSYASRL